MDNFVYYNPVKLLFGKGQLDKVAEEILPYGKKILFVYGQKHLKQTGVYEKITKLLKDAGIEWIELAGVHPNPRLELVKKGIDICKKENIDFILGAGGGSTSDTAKAIAMGSKVDYDIWHAYEDFHNIMHGNKVDSPHIPSETLPFGVIMTKAGTGSGFDYTSVLSNHATKEKLMVINKALYAKFLIHDVTLIYTLPENERVFGIADIMTHIMEQYFTPTEHTELLDRYKEANLLTVIESGKEVLKNPENYNAQANLLYIAALACCDLSMTGTLGGWDSHMIEHEITAATDLNHGYGMAIVYYGWMKYVINTLPGKFARFATNVWKVKRNGKNDFEVGMEGIEKTAEFWRSMGIKLSLKDAGISMDVINRAAKQAVRFGPLGILKQLKEADVLKILKAVI